MPDDARPAAHSESRDMVDARQEPRTIRDLMRNPGTVARFKQIMPRHLSAERMLRVCAMAINSTPALAKCEPISLLGAMLACASFGLEPNTPLGHAYLIPFKKSVKKGNRWEETYQVQLIIGYRGYIDLARRSGNMVSIHADVVYEGDEFSFEYGSNQHLRHVPKGARGDRKPKFAYAHAKLTDGEAFEVLPYAEVLDIRDGSQGYQAALIAKDEAENDENKKWRMKAYESSPWVAFEHEMAAKTMIRRVSKYLPMSLEFATAIATDSAADRGTLDLTAISAHPETLVDGVVTEREEDEGEAQNKQTGNKQQEQPKTEGKGTDAPKADAKAKESDKAAGDAPQMKGPQPEPQEEQAKPQPKASTVTDKPGGSKRAAAGGKGLFTND